MADLVETLTPSEQEFLDQCLLGEDSADESPREYSSATPGSWPPGFVRRSRSSFVRSRRMDRRRSVRVPPETWPSPEKSSI